MDNFNIPIDMEDMNEFLNDCLVRQDFTRVCPLYKEILKLKDLLDKDGIPYDMRPYMHGYVIHYPGWDRDTCICSAVEHIGSYGNLLDTIEIMGLLTEDEEKSDEVLGYLTAEDVFARIKKSWEEENDPAMFGEL